MKAKFIQYLTIFFMVTNITTVFASESLSSLYVHTIAENSQGEIFIGSEKGGVYRLCSDNESIGYLGFINSDVEVIGINSSDVIFVGTSAEGVFRSEDNGESWTKTNNGLGYKPWVWGFLFLDNGDILVGITGGVYRSSDNGETWISSGLDTYAVRWFIQSADGNILAGTVYGGIFRSSDNGATWELTNKSTTSFLTVRFASGPDNAIYASTWGQGIYRTYNNGDTWENITPYTYDPRINFVTIDNNGNIYTSAENDGMYISTDNGSTWESINESFHRVKVLHIASNGIMYIGRWGSGVYYSENGGDLWYKIKNIPEEIPQDIHIHTLATNSQGDVFAGSEYGGVYRLTENGETSKYLGFINSDVEIISINSSDVIFVGTSAEGVYRSEDNGESWVQINNGLGSEPWVWGFLFLDNGDILVGITGGVYRSSDNGDTWASSGLINYTARWFTQTPNGDIFATAYTGGIFRSTDSGHTWILTSSTTILFEAVRIITDSDGNIFASSWGQGIHRSSDNGNSWTNITPDTYDPRINFTTFDNEGNLYTSAENEGMYISTDNGSSWDRIFKLLPFRVKAIIFGDNGQIYAGTWGSGLYHSFDYGEEWDEHEEPYVYNDINVNSIAFNSLGYIFAGTESNGLLFSDDNGENFSMIGFESINIKKVSINYADIIFVGTQEKGIYRSVDNGNSWWHTTYGLHDNPSIYNFLFSTNHDIFVGTDKGIYLSDDNGESWNFSGLEDLTIWSFTENSEGIIFAAASNDGVFCSEDNGETWELTSDYTLNLNILKIIANQDDELFASTYGNGLYHSSDNGLNWEKLDLPVSNIHCIAFDQQENLYATIQGDIYVSGDYGNSWQQTFENLENKWVIDLVFNSDGDIYVGTWSYENIPVEYNPRSGVFCLKQGENTWNYKEISYILTEIQYTNPTETQIKSTPNPFNPSTVISYSLEQAGIASLAIYNVTGQKVTELASGFHAAGNHSVVWDASDYAAGMYIVALKINRTLVTHKILLVK